MLTWSIHERPGESVLVALTGELVGETWTQPLLDFLEEHYVNDGVSTIVVDLTDVGAVDLEGVGTLLTLWKESGRRGKQFVVRGASGAARDRLMITGVLDALERGSASSGDP